jgi:hypothetical protein
MDVVITDVHILINNSKNMMMKMMIMCFSVKCGEAWSDNY